MGRKQIDICIANNNVLTFKQYKVVNGVNNNVITVGKVSRPALDCIVKSLKNSNIHQICCSKLIKLYFYIKVTNLS